MSFFSHTFCFKTCLESIGDSSGLGSGKSDVKSYGSSTTFCTIFLNVIGDFETGFLCLSMDGFWMRGIGLRPSVTVACRATFRPHARTVCERSVMTIGFNWSDPVSCQPWTRLCHGEWFFCIHWRWFIKGCVVLVAINFCLFMYFSIKLGKITELSCLKTFG